MEDRGQRTEVSELALCLLSSVFRFSVHDLLPRKPSTLVVGEWGKPLGFAILPSFHDLKVDKNSL